MSTTIDIEKVVAAVKSLEARISENARRQDELYRAGKHHLTLSLADFNRGLNTAYNTIRESIVSACRDQGVKSPWET